MKKTAPILFSSLLHCFLQVLHVDGFALSLLNLHSQSKRNGQSLVSCNAESSSSSTRNENECPLLKVPASSALDCPQRDFDRVEGILETIVGYSGSSDPEKYKDPTYKNIKDYAETIRVRYNPNKLEYTDLLNMFFSFHTPENPSWCGTQYRSAIFAFSDEQYDIAKAMVKEWGALGRFVSIEKASDFYKAEEYHQKYLEKW